MVLRRHPRTSQDFISTRPGVPSSEPVSPRAPLRPAALLLISLVTAACIILTAVLPSHSPVSMSTNIVFHQLDSDTVISLPETSHIAIRELLMQSAQTVHEQFITTNNSTIPHLINRPSEVISAKILPHNKTYSSAVFSDTITTASGATTQNMQAWTFRNSDGAIITVDELIAQSENGKEQLDTILAATKGTAPLHPSYHTLSFVPVGEHTFKLYVPQKNHTTQEATITITPSLSPYFTNDTAQTIFTLPEFNHPTSANQEIATECMYKKCVALTFDDGPGIYTDELLDILKKYEIKATFFLLGMQVQKFPDSVKREVSEGHIIANHTWNHPELTLISESSLRNQITRTNTIIEKVAGIRPLYLRPPYGATDDSVRTITRALEMASIFWSVDMTDWNDLSSERICKHAVADTRPGSIILMHDIHQASVKAVPCIIEALTKKGYRLVTVPELLGKTQPGGYYYEAG